MEIIDELEPFRRGVYTGAVGCLGRGGAIDLALAIRTAVLGPSRVAVAVGGGVVADSTAARELEETEEKAAAWRAALTGP
jgi:anthranilate/para-aminobenzoate synthase component I